MNKAVVRVFVSNPPKPQHSRLLSSLRAGGLCPLVDSTHTEKDWFMEQFSNTPHKIYYTSPYILSGVVDETDFNIMGTPEICIYCTADTEVPTLVWENVVMFLEAVVFDVMIDNDVRHKALAFLGPSFIEADGFTELTLDDDLVVMVDAKEHYYAFEYKVYEEIDMILCQVTRPRTVPYLVSIRNYEKEGMKQLFTDLFIDQTWGKTETDVKFLKRLWEEYMEGPFDINELLLKATERCFPNSDKEIFAEPVVYRQTIQEFEETEKFKQMFISSADFQKAMERLGGIKL